MHSKFNRLDFLKTTLAFSLLPLIETLPSVPLSHGNQSLPNIIVILYDTLSALHLSIYGYTRKTSPNMENLANRSNVYHSHRSSANFTTPSTASLFTSTYPWTHRVLGLRNLIDPNVLRNNIFSLLKGIYHNVVFTQNVYADMLLYQLNEGIHQHERLDNNTLISNTIYNRYFPNDGEYGLKSHDQFLFRRDNIHGSLFYSLLSDMNIMLEKTVLSEELQQVHPNGLPRLSDTEVYFLNHQVTNGIIELMNELHMPSFTYVHLMPPHEPYRPTREYLGLFKDGWSPPTKKRHRAGTKVPQERLNERRLTYDQYVANMDAEFGRLIEHMETIGLLENSYVILTSDHGELFERGVHGHSTPLLFEPVIRIPLLISSPGQNRRKDFYSPTSNVDLMPTILKIAGLDIPKGIDGQVLPGFFEKNETPRSIFAIEASKNPKNKPLRKATVAMIEDRYKLIHYRGYNKYDNKYEFYDLENDPEEVENLYPSHPAIKEMQKELDFKIQEGTQNRSDPI